MYSLMHLRCLVLKLHKISAFTSHKDLSTLNNIMNNGLSKLNTWFKSNKLSLNLKKTNYMLLGTRNKTNQSKDKFKLSIDDTEVKEVSTFKFLGITVDQNLTWKNHVDDLAKKCSRSIDILHKVKQFLPESALLSLYYTLFLSHIKGQRYIASVCHIISLIEFRKPFTQSKCINCMGIQNNNILKKLFHTFIQTVILKLVMLNYG